MEGVSPLDTFIEQIVVKEKGIKELSIIIGSIVLALLVVYFIGPLLFGLLSVLSFLLIIGLGYGVWRLITSLNIEYEYSVTNGDIDIDEIVAQRKRKRIVSVAGSKIESMEPYSAAAFTERQFDRRVIAAPSLHAPDLWCFTYHSKKSGHTIVVFQPQKRLLDALKVGLSSMVAREMNKKLTQ